MRRLTSALLVLAAAGCDGGGGARSPAAQAKPVLPGERPAAPAAPGAVGFSVTRSTEHGPYLTDLNGRPLYLLESDQATSGGCHDTCVGVWPPLFAGQTAPVTGDSVVDARLVATITRRDGLRQVSFNGHPLYYYLGDGGPGQILGHRVEGSWGEWYLVSPQGGQVGDHRRRPRDDNRGEGRRGRG